MTGKMQYAIMLYFDEDTSKKANEIMLKLRDYSNNDYMLSNNMPGHITLAMWLSEYDYINEIKELAGKTKSFDVDFSSIGFFNDEERHIFLSPVKNKAINNLHKKIYNMLSLEDESDYIQIFKDENVWVPHMTIGYQAKKESFAEALKHCADIKLPIKATACKMAYSICCPFTELAVIDLG